MTVFLAMSMSKSMFLSEHEESLLLPTDWRSSKRPLLRPNPAIRRRGAGTGRLSDRFLNEAIF